jgi:hypothetical protein
MSHNTSFIYLYRDGSNYKQAGKPVVLTGEGTQEQLLRLKNACLGVRFIASQVGIPECFLWNPDMIYNPDDPATYPLDMLRHNFMINSNDHCWHEFEGLEDTLERPTDPRTVEELVVAFEKARKEGWKIFDPISRRKTSAPEVLAGIEQGLKEAIDAEHAKSKFTIITGNPVDGFELYGVFDLETDAVAHANEDADLPGSWHIMPISSLE